MFKNINLKILTKIGIIKTGIILSFLAVAIAGVTPSYAKINPNSKTTSNRLIVERSSTSAPLGFQIFCLKNPSECKSSSSKKIAYSSQLMRVLSQVNRKVNRSIRPRNDRGRDIWTLNARVGDCEEYILAKRSKLIKMGVSSGALRIATATTRRGVGHAVLIVRTDKGDFVLDNRTNTIKPWNKTDLRWVAISGSNPKKWRKIG